MDYTTMTEQQLQELIDDANAEILRRQNIEVVNQEVSVVLRQARLNGVTEAPEPGAPWAQPTDASNSYVSGDVVTHAGKKWESTVTPNTWEPPTGWREQTADGSPPEWIQPSGSADAYSVGDRVAYKGHVYESVIAGNVWSPEEHPAGWKEID